MTKFVLDVDIDGVELNLFEIRYLRYYIDMFMKEGGFPFTFSIEPINDYLSRMSEQDKDYE